MTYHNINFPDDQIAELCLRHRIRRLSLFGSILRDDFKPESDIDLLVEFEPGARVGMIRLAGMEIELSEMLGHKVDLNTPQCLSRYYVDDVLREARMLYAAA